MFRCGRAPPTTATKKLLKYNSRRKWNKNKNAQGPTGTHTPHPTFFILSSVHVRRNATMSRNISTFYIIILNVSAYIHGHSGMYNKADGPKFFLLHLYRVTPHYQVWVHAITRHIVRQVFVSSCFGRWNNAHHGNLHTKSTTSIQHYSMLLYTPMLYLRL